MADIPVDYALLRPTRGDLAELHELYADPRVWEHAPHMRHAKPEQTAQMLDKAIASWEESGLGSWIVRNEAGDLIGFIGCNLRGNGAYWNLGYRISPEAQGKGITTRVAMQALLEAKETREDVPIIALLFEHNSASKRVAEKVGLQLAYRGLVPGGGDEYPIERIYSDRPIPLTTIQRILER